ncbi:MAG: LL-diaminopimelate aminotransferase [Deltaproteobacteria bacterium]|nr:LL-diaminopimelate aminotransferase [Deltaproteobacteria bacterium]
MMRIEKSGRIRELPPYLFAQIDKIKEEQVAKGVDVIDLTIGDPDLPTFPGIVAHMEKAIHNPKNHRYPSYAGMRELRLAVAQWYRDRFTVALDPETEVIILIGSKEGIAHLPLAFIDPGDIGLVPDPGYPVYKTSILFAGGTPHLLPLIKENQYLPDLELVPNDVLQKSKLLFLNYPNNPTAAIANRDFLERAISFCRRHDIILCHDAAYSEIYFKEKPVGLFELGGAKEVGIEFHSLSKTFNMTGWRLGFAVGNSEVIAGLGQVKTNIDSGVFQAVQEAGIFALRTESRTTQELRDIYKERRDIIIAGLAKMGLDVDPPRASFYVWAPVPPGYTSLDFTTFLLNKTAVLTTPGNGFGPSGEGYIRISLTDSTDRIKEAANRLSNVSI